MSGFSPTTGEPRTLNAAPGPNKERGATYINLKVLIGVVTGMLAVATAVGGYVGRVTGGKITEHIIGGHPAQVRLIGNAVTEARERDEQIGETLAELKRSIAKLADKLVTSEQLRTLSARAATERAKLRGDLEKRDVEYEQRLKNIEQAVRETREIVRELERR